MCLRRHPKFRLYFWPPHLFQVVKVADFGVARVRAQSGVMTAETGTYRWMAPEVWFLFFIFFNVPNLRWYEYTSIFEQLFVVDL